MDRRLLLTAAACSPVLRVLAQEDAPRPRHKIPAAELYEALAARFPLRFGAAGLMELRVSAPQLLLLPPRNKLGAALRIQLDGVQRFAGGEVDLVFALRYEPADQTVRAHQPEILELRWPGLPPDSMRALQRLVPALAREVGEVVLRRLTPRELALADTMGFEPEQLTVVDDGLVILFGPKPRR